MPCSLLFALNSDGRVFGLSSNGTKWREFIYLGLEFKQLSAVPNFLWAVGGDRQIYVHVHGLDIPIRVKEESYENERWTPFDGFSKRLLPTDRYNFSSQDGTINRTLKKIRLPSMAWQWEGDWKLELNLNGQPLDHDGWTYAVDFPATFYATKQWTSCVRRRKWVRYRKYIALNSWCAVAPLHKDPTKEPFIGVAVGGHCLPGCKDGTLLVWAVTASGRIMFRTDVSSSCPEGQRWSSVTVPPGCEVSQVSVGATGLVWAVLWNGKALVRTGITRECFMGNAWVEVETPGESLSLQQIAIGYNGLWAITRDSRVWFRKGINGDNAGLSESLAKGTGWIEMIGNMSDISVSSNDQVWAVGADDKILYFRTGVTQEDLMGKTWRPLGAPTQLSRASSSASLAGGDEGSLREKRHRSWSSLNRHSGIQESYPESDEWNETCHSAPTAATRGCWHKSSAASNSTGQFSMSNESLSCSLPTVPENRVETSNEIAVPKIVEEVKEYSSQSPKENILNSYENVSHPVCAFPTRGTVVATEAHYAADSIVFESDELSGVYSEQGEREDEDDHLYWADSEAFWSTVEAGACLVNVNHLPKWFSDVGTKKMVELVKPWRMKILNELKGRLTSDFVGLENYERAVDSSTWTKSGRCKCLLPGEISFKDCLVELEWVCNEEDNVDCATLVLSSLNKEESWAHLNLRDLTAVVGCSVPKSPRLALYTRDRTLVKLQFGTEDEFEEWKSELSTVCCRIKSLSKIPSPQSIWVTTAIGDIFVCDLSESVVGQNPSAADENMHCVVESFTGCDMPIQLPLHAGFSPGSTVTIWGCVRDKAKSFAIDFVCSEESTSADIAFHFNPRFEEELVVQNAKINSVWGQEERLRIIRFETGELFQIDIGCTDDSYVVSVDGVAFSKFAIRKKTGDECLMSEYVTHVQCVGDISVTKMKYSSKEFSLEPRSMYWQQIPGHLRKVQTAAGITWGIGFDNTAWLYVGNQSSGSQLMHDKHYYFVYENQRWNPLTGYTSHVLPTDRFMWSDVTGKQKRTRENTVLLSKRWQWVNDWSVDFHTPGGVDTEGWQYAMDFPSSYHGTKNLTDYVRRRRWFRCAKLETPGPWVELGYTPLSDCSLYSDGKDVTAWAVAANGYVLFRKGLSTACPAGISWEHVSIDEQVVSIACGMKQVWVVGKSGAAYCRIGITSSNPLGSAWETIEAPPGASLKQVAILEGSIWVLDATGNLSIRSDVTPSFPFGSHWKQLPAFCDDHGVVDDWGLPGVSGANTATGFRQIAASNRLWALTNSGRLACRTLKGKLEGKVVLITGASSGLGEALAHCFYRAGCKVILSARREKELERVRGILLQKYQTTPTYPPVILRLDLSDVDGIAKQAQKALSIFGHIDILINNAGISHRGKVIETTNDVDSRVMSVNYLGPIALAKAILPKMVEQKKGHIVAISSVQGLIGIPYRSAYAASKHALQAFHDVLRAEVAQHNIKVTVVSPGYINTNLSVNALTGTGEKYNNETTASGQDPMELAEILFKSIVNEKKDLLIAPFTARAAVVIRHFCPTLFFWIMKKRAQKHTF
ncbi:hypothetical protein RUM43_005512 [Polyplax serrata]|uniref:Galectin domain-containing protein n=1 Tax=Polyplax serrata TaxID=468196 RepID=A0AAN8PWX7_POLSC